MQTNPELRRAYEAFLALPFGFAPPSGSLPITESTPTPSVTGDFTEGPAPSWEAAWIDLGGEG
jgi:hypothetical protein